ncbi:MAG: hypothetical protein HUJ61_03850 [Bacilli bacterium]|nr:hypothetical protein [Bacilli bacterium]
MKKNLFLTTGLLLGAIAGLSSCSNSNTITICASELPHAKILNECISDIVKEDGFKIKVTVIDWTIQNDAVASKDYDANYFQHIPYLNTYDGDVKLSPACKVHYEKLCLYAKDVNHKTLQNGDSIEIVNDVSNIERALQLLKANDILDINDDCYEDGEFKKFDVAKPNSCVTWKEGYENCTLTCIKESNLCASLPDYDFGIIPGNTALTGLGSDYASRISFGENPTPSTISEKANIICVREADLNSEKTKTLVKAFGDARVKTYIETTFGESVTYAYENLLK